MGRYWRRAVRMGMILFLGMTGCGGGGGGGETPAAPPPLPASPPWEGARQYGTAEDDSGGHVTVDSRGNVLAVGSTFGTFDNTLGGTVNQGDQDAYLIRFDNSGKREWAVQFGTAAADNPTGVTTDGARNIYVAGVTQGSLDNVNQGVGTSDLFVRKYDPVGSRIWGTQVGTPGNEDSNNVVVDGTGNVYVVGTTERNLASPGQPNLGGNTDAYLVKLGGTDGRILGIAQFGTTGDDFGKSVAVDAAGNVYVAGETTGAFPGRTSAGGRDLFVARFNAAGSGPIPAPVWITQAGSAGSEQVFGISAGTDGILRVGGSTDGALGGGAVPAFQAGFFLFMEAGTGSIVPGSVTRFEYPGTVFVRGVAIDARNNVLLAGYFFDDDPLPLQEQVFVRKYDAGGKFLWDDVVGTSETDQASDIAVHPAGDAFVTGTTVGVWPGNANLGGPGNQDAYVIRLDPNGILR